MLDVVRGGAPPPRPAADLLAGWLPERGSRANPLRALVFALAARRGPLDVDELGDELQAWLGHRLPRRTVRRHADALLERGLLALSGDRLTVPGDVAARAWREGVRLRWLADAAGRGLSVDALLLLGYRDQRSHRGRVVAWIDSVEHTSDSLGIARATVRAGEAELRAAGILAVGAHPGRRWRRTAGGAGTVRRSPLAGDGPRQQVPQAQDALSGNRIAGDALDRPVPRPSAEDDPRQRSGALRAAGSGSLRSPSEEPNGAGVRTGTRPPRWLVELEERAAAAHQADQAARDRCARLGVLRNLRPLLLELAPATALEAVLVAGGVFVALAGTTGPGLRAKRQALAGELAAAGVDARDVLAWLLLALRRRRRRVRCLGSYFVASLAAARGDGRRNPGDALAGLLWRRLRALLGREAQPADVLPERLRGDGARLQDVHELVASIVAVARVDALDVEAAAAADEWDAARRRWA